MIQKRIKTKQRKQNSPARNHNLKFNLKEFQNSVIITLTLSHSHTIRTEGTQNPPPSDPNPFKLSPINNIFPMENSDSAPSTSPPAPLSVVGSFFFCLILTFPNSDILFFFFFSILCRKKRMWCRSVLRLPYACWFCHLFVDLNSVLSSKIMYLYGFAGTDWIAAGAAQ